MIRKTTVWMSRCAFISMLVVLSACDTRLGNGKITTQPRTLDASFTTVRSTGNIDIDIREGAERTAAVTVDENLQESFTVTVVGGVLVVNNIHQTRTSYAAHVDVTMPRVERVEQDGASMMRLHDLVTGPSLSIVTNDVGGVEYSGTIPAVDVSLDGPGNVKLTGTASMLTIRTDDFGSVNAKDLVATSADIQCNGAGDVSVQLGGGNLKLGLFGTGSIEWSGQANVTESVDHGTGSITHR